MHMLLFSTWSQARLQAFFTAESWCLLTNEGDANGEIEDALMQVNIWVHKGWLSYYPMHIDAREGFNKGRFIC